MTGHDRGEIYVTEIPQVGSELKLVAVIKVADIEGQGIAWDRTEADRVLWGINKKQQKVIQIELPKIR